MLKSYIMLQIEVIEGFLSQFKMNSANWPAPNVWLFIAQLVEHRTLNAVLKFFYMVIKNYFVVQV